VSEREHMEGVIGERIAQGATGALEVREDKKRWIFFLAGGALVYTRSNLKSEQTESLRARHGDLPTNELIRLQAVRRLRAVICAEGAEHEWHEGAHPPQMTPVNALSALIEALAQALDATQLGARAAELHAGYPRVLGDLGGLGLPPGLEQYLQDLDGGRRGEDVVAFAPVPPDQVDAALIALRLLGELEVTAVGLDAQIVAASTGSLGAGDPETADPETADPETADPETADPETADPETADPETADPETGDPEPAGLDAADLFDAIGPGPDEVPPTHEVVLPAAGAPESESLDVGALLAGLAETLPPPAAGPSPAAFVPAAPAAPAAPAEAAPPAPGAVAPPAGPPRSERLAALGRRMGRAANHFELLEVSWDSDPDEFRTAYTSLARELHPDRYHDGLPEDRELATELFDQLRVAWEVLGSDSLRREYIDQVIHGKKSAEEQALEQLNAYWAADDAFRKGLTIFTNGRVREAHDLFKQAAEAMPDELQFQAFYGYTTYAIHRVKDPPAAEAGLIRLRDALERNKSQERQLDAGWTLLGRAYRERGELDAARRALIQALRVNPANADATREMRRLERDGGDRGEGGKGGKAGKKGGFLAGLFGKR